MGTGVLFQIQSLLILCLMAFGVYRRRHRTAHVKIMACTITWDILLILQIELNRGAIAKASQAITNTAFLNIHVGLALFCVLGYIGSIITGRKLLKGPSALQPIHKKLGWSILVIRILVFATSFLVVPASI